MLDVSCDYCGKPLTEPGALMFSPPDPRTRQCLKLHVCVLCWRSVEGLAEKAGSGADKSQWEPYPDPVTGETVYRRVKSAEASGGVCACSCSVGGPHPSCIVCEGTGCKGR